MSGGVAAHSGDSAGGAGADGVGVATGMFSGDGNGAIGSTNDGIFVVKGICFTKVDDEAGVLGTARERDSSAGLNAEGRVGLGVGNTGFGGGGVAPAAPDINAARRGCGAAGVGLSANICGIGHGTNVIFDFLFGVLANDERS